MRPGCGGEDYWCIGAGPISLPPALPNGLEANRRTWALALDEGPDWGWSFELDRLVTDRVFTAVEIARLDQSFADLRKAGSTIVSRGDRLVEVHVGRGIWQTVVASGAERS